MKKGLLFGVSNGAAWVSVFLCALIIFTLFHFDKQEKEEVVHEEFQDYYAKMVVINYLRQKVDADVDKDGSPDAETMADIVILSHGDSDMARQARIEWTTRTTNMANEFGISIVRVVYPDNQEMLVRGPPAPGSFAGPAEEEIRLPLPNNKDVRILVN